MPRKIEAVARCKVLGTQVSMRVTSPLPRPKRPVGLPPPTVGRKKEQSPFSDLTKHSTANNRHK